MNDTDDLDHRALAEGLLAQGEQLSNFGVRRAHAHALLAIEAALQDLVTQIALTGSAASTTGRGVDGLAMPMFAGTGGQDWSTAGLGDTGPPDSCPVGGHAARCCTFSFTRPLCHAARDAVLAHRTPFQAARARAAELAP